MAERHFGGARGLLPAVGQAALWLSGWRITGRLPEVPRYVMIVAPHTSNYDFFVGLAAKFALGLQAKWLGKHSLFRGPVGWLLRALGGIPVDRARPDGTVEAVLAELQASPTFVLALSPRERGSTSRTGRRASTGSPWRRTCPWRRSPSTGPPGRSTSSLRSG